MKTNVINIRRMLVVLLALAAIAMCANAQNIKPRLTVNEVLSSQAFSDMVGSGCAKFYGHVAADSIFDGFTAENHCGVTIRPYGGYAGLNGSSTDLGDQNDNTWSYGVALGYTYHQENWLVEPFVNVFVEGNTSATIETLKTKAISAGAQAGVSFFPCSAFNFFVFGEYDFTNTTSKSVLDNGVAQGDLPWQSNSKYIGGGAGVKMRLGWIKSSKTVNMGGRAIREVSKVPVKLVGQFKYLHTSVDKPHMIDAAGQTTSHKLGLDRWQVTVGLEFTLHLL